MGKPCRAGPSTFRPAFSRARNAEEDGHNDLMDDAAVTVCTGAALTLPVDHVPDPAGSWTVAVDVVFETNGRGCLGWLVDPPGAFVRGPAVAESRAKIGPEIGARCAWLDRPPVARRHGPRVDGSHTCGRRGRGQRDPPGPRPAGGRQRGRADGGVRAARGLGPKGRPRQDAIRVGSRQGRSLDGAPDLLRAGLRDDRPAVLPRPGDPALPPAEPRHRCRAVRRLIWHDRIHARAMGRMGRRFGETGADPARVRLSPAQAWTRTAPARVARATPGRAEHRREIPRGVHAARGRRRSGPRAQRLPRPQSCRRGGRRSRHARTALPPPTRVDDDTAARSHRQPPQRDLGLGPRVAPGGRPLPPPPLRHPCHRQRHVNSTSLPSGIAPKIASSSQVVAAAPHTLAPITTGVCTSSSGTP